MPAPTTKAELPTYTPPPLEKWQRERLEQGFFDWVLPSRLEWFVTSQAAVTLNMSVQSVLNLADLGKLEVQTKQITGNRKEIIISRRSILLHLAANTQLDPRDLATRAIEFIRSIRCAKVLGLIHEATTNELKRRAA